MSLNSKIYLLSNTETEKKDTTSDLRTSLREILAKIVAKHVLRQRQKTDLVSLSNKMSYCKISQSFQAAISVLRIVRSLWNLTGISKVLLPMHPSNLKASVTIIQTTNLVATIRHLKWITYFIGTIGAPIYVSISRLILRSRKALKPRELYLELPDRSESVLKRGTAFLNSSCDKWMGFIYI